MNRTNHTKNLLAALLLFVVVVSQANPVTTPSAGDIAFVGFNADGNDDFAVVVLNDLPASTVIFFTDKEYDGAALIANEGNLQWTTPGSVITAGTIIIFSDVSNSPSASQGTLVDGTDAGFSLAGTDEVILAYVSDDDTEGDADTFLAGVTNEANNFDGDNADGSVIPPGLTLGTTAIAIDGDNDVMIYNGDRSTETQFSDYLSMIGDSANWLTDDGSGDQSNDLNAPDLPFSTTAFSTTSTLTYASGAWSNNAGGPNIDGLTLTVEDDLSLNSSNSIGTINLSTGNTLTITGTALTVTGLLNVSGGDFVVDVDVTVDNINFNNVSGSLTINDGNRLTMTGSVLNNTNASITIESGGEFKPSGEVTNVTFKRSVSATSYTLVSTPMKNYTAKSNKYQELYFLSEDGGQDNYGSWLAVEGVESTYQEGRGFTVYANSDKNFTGTTNYGTITIPVYGKDADSRADGDTGWQFLGNPYTFPISIQSFFDHADNVGHLQNTVYLYNSSDEYTASIYADDGVIMPGQGFFIKVITDEPITDITFDPSMIAADGGTFYRQEPIAYFGLTFTAANGENFTSYYQFSNEFKAEYDPFDSYIFGKTKDSFFQGNLINDGLFGVVSLPDIFEPLSIPIQLNIKKDQVISVEVSKFENIPDGASIVLVNKETGETFDINEQSAIQTILKNSSAKSQFEIVFGSNTITGLLPSQDFVNISANKDVVTLKFDPKKKIEKGVINIWTLDGKQLFNSSFNLKDDEIHFPFSGEGLQIVRVSTQFGTNTIKVIR